MGLGARVRVRVGVRSYLATLLPNYLTTLQLRELRVSSGNLRTLSLCGCQQLAAVHLVRLAYPYSYPYP